MEAAVVVVVVVAAFVDAAFVDAVDGNVTTGRLAWGADGFTVDRMIGMVATRGSFGVHATLSINLDSPGVAAYDCIMHVHRGRPKTTGTPSSVDGGATSTTTAATMVTSTSSTMSTPSLSVSPASIDIMEATTTTATTASQRRTSGLGLTQKLVDPKRATELPTSVAAMLAFTPEELAFARAHPVVISADHNGAAIAATLTAFLKGAGIAVTNLAAPMAAAAKGEKFPYAQAALPALVGLTTGSADRVVLICGNGIGMRDVASAWPGTTVCYGEILHEVRSARTAHDANVLALGARLLGDDADLAALFVKTFVATAHEGMPERYQGQTDQVQAWATLAAEKGASLRLEDFGDAIPTGGTTGTPLKLGELMLRRHQKD